MLNVLHIVSNKIYGGPEQYAHDLLYSLKADGHYVEIVCKNYPTVVDHFRKIDIPVSLLPLKGMTDLDSAMRFARMIKRGKNIVHVHSMRDAFMALMAKRLSENKNNRVVLTCHKVERPRLSFLHKRIYKELDKVIFPSQLAYDEFVAMRPKVDKDKLVMIHDSVLRDFAPSATNMNLREELGIAQGKALIMFHGRISPEKGVGVLLNALSHINRETFHLVILGSGQPKYVSQLKSFVVANNLVGNVSFLGFKDELLPLIEQCDFGVLPSVWREPFGIANLEYMMKGKAHITTNNGAQREYLRDGRTAIFVSPDNYASLAAEIKRLIDNPALRRQIGEAAKADYDQKLAYCHFYRQIVELYQSL